MGNHSTITWKELLKKISEADNEKEKKQKNISCGKGLYVRTFHSKKTFTVNWYYRKKDKSFEYLGEFKKLTLALAFKLAEEKKLQEQEEISIEVKKSISFGELAKQWLATKKQLVRFDNIRKSVEYLTPLNDFQFNEITVNKAKEILLAQDITPYKVQEVIAALCNITDLAIEEGICENNPFYVLKKSPSFGKHEKNGFKFVFHNQLSELFKRIDILPEQFKYYFLLHLLLCLRPGETRQLKFSYFNLKEEILYVPGKLMKEKRQEPFRVPLAKQVIILVKKIKSYNKEFLGDLNNKEDCDFLFPRKRSLTPITERDIADRLKTVAGNLSQPHGFRKTARSWMAENRIPIEVAAKCLDHTLPVGADIFYQKSDLLELKRPVMQSWADYVEYSLTHFFNNLLK